MNDFQNRIMNILTDTLKVQVTDANMELIETGLLDSLGLISLLVQLEKEFAITISVKELEVDDFRSITRIEAFVAAVRRKAALVEVAGRVPKA